MPLVCVGLNHHTAPLEVRERLAFSPGELRQIVSSRLLHEAGAAAGLSEFVLVSTCNRTEVYGGASTLRGPGTAPTALLDSLAGYRGLTLARIQPLLYGRTSLDALRHLCRVAAGLDSQVLGETEVLGQIAAAHRVAAEAGATGPVLDAAFRAAVRAGRRARAQSAISRHPVSIGSEAVRLLETEGCDLTAARVAILGTGTVAERAGEALHRRRVRDLLVVGRTRAHAERLARALRGAPVPWHELESTLRHADVVICATSAPHHVVTVELVQGALRGRPDHQPIRFVDLAVPRDVEPGVRSLPGIEVADLDDIQHRVAGNLAERRSEVPIVEAIIDAEVTRFDEWCQAESLRPLVAALRVRMEAIRRREVDRAQRRLGSNGLAGALEHFDAFSRALVNKLLDQPTRRLRQEPDPARAAQYARAVRHLFDLDGDAEPRDEASERP